MDKLIIEGGISLKGEVQISGAKNAVLPILTATLLTDDTCIIKNFPRLRDTHTMMGLLRSLGKTVDVDEDKIIIFSNGQLQHVADYQLVSTMRGSFCVLGPLLAKLNKAKVSLPGGCVIGVRPVDLHLKGIRALGARVNIENGYVIAKAKRLRGTSMYLGGSFGSSVLATANVMMAASLADGQTIIESAACEPEIEDLANFLIAMGAKIKGHGTPRVSILGVKNLHGAEYKITSDRIEAGTYILMAAATKSDILIKDACFSHLSALVDALANVGVKLERTDDCIRVRSHKTFNPVDITTYPYPGFPTDLQAQFMALMATIPGISIITDKIFPDRFMHIAELNRMGANIKREGMSAIVQGVKRLHGAPLMASDLRASAALVIAGLAAKGTTEIQRIYHLERGYEDLDEKLTQIGARVYRKKG